VRSPYTQIGASKLLLMSLECSNSLVDIDACTASATPDLPQNSRRVPLIESLVLNTEVIGKTQVLSKSLPHIPVECKEATARACHGLTKSLNSKSHYGDII
jgi:hypothetical protein